MKFTRNAAAGIVSGVLVILVLSLQAAPAPGEVAFGVGRFKDPIYSGVFAVDTDASTARMVIHTPDREWYGATDGFASDYFYAVTSSYFATNAGLYRISVDDWSVTHLGNLETKMKELAMDDSTGTLYGTNYTDLYSIDPSSCAITHIGPYGKRPDGTPIDATWSLDYDPTAGAAGELVAVDRQQVGDMWKSATYHINRTTGAASYVGLADTHDLSDIWLSDIWYDPDSTTTHAVGNYPSRLFTLDTNTGAATQTGTLPNIYITGMANATATGPLPDPIYPQKAVPATLGDYKTGAGADAYASVEYTGDPGEFVDDEEDDYIDPPNEPVEVSVFASADLPYHYSWQESNSVASSNALQVGDEVEAFAKVHVFGDGDDNGNPDIWLNSDANGSASVEDGQITIGTSEGVPLGQPGILHVLLELNEDGGSMDTWVSLRVWDEATGNMLLTHWEECGGEWAMDVETGQVLGFSMDCISGTMEEVGGWYDATSEATVRFHATGQMIPEPSTLSLIVIGGLAALFFGRSRLRGKTRV